MHADLGITIIKLINFMSINKLIPFVSDEFDSVIILNVENVSCKIIPFNPTKLNNLDLITSISTPCRSDLRKRASLKNNNYTKISKSHTLYLFETIF